MKSIQFTKKYKITNRGFGVLEVLFAIAFFTIGMMGVAIFMIDILDTSENSYNLNQAVLLAEEGLEAVKSIRDIDFASLSDVNDYGIYFDELNSQWVLSNNEQHKNIQISDSKTFTRTISISGIGDIKQIQSKVTWPKRVGQNGETILTTYLSNWKMVQEEPTPEPEP
ncbi:MAG TPA: hypothetical protein PJ997_00305 [Candidatus Paceibacterota bacterium]|nr:hypothetical protein [Candidatus Paceibacterota bacterium]HMP18773.1 hypothetical protein [Candidatus Paceibacterota bacterium]HMP85329.1 hypothetical protein [Candidatus Paceibacterota bacterium]